jgi:hypothetical protein
VGGDRRASNVMKKTGHQEEQVAATPAAGEQVLGERHDHAEVEAGASGRSAGTLRRRSPALRASVWWLRSSW